MAIPKKGSWHIVVDDENYRWLIRRKATYSQTDYGGGKLHVAVEKVLLDNQIGSTLLIISNRPHPKDWGAEDVRPITPYDVATWIKEAIASGWQPDQSGAMCAYQLAETHNDKLDTLT